jgi:N-acetylneuraminic acid mutarotase
MKIRWGLLALWAAGCSAGDTTSVRLAVRYDAAWGLDGLRVAALTKAADAALAHEVRLLVPDAWSSAITVEVWGHKAHQRFAYGSATVTLVRGGEARGEVVLARLPCGAWCTPGTTSCLGENQLTCTKDELGCTAWSNPAPCTGATPYCSFGVCLAACVDECAAGEKRCEGPGALRLCGQQAGDSCLHWLAPLSCADGQTCSNGACRATCQDECKAGEVRCLGAGTITCGDIDHDGCLEWGPVVACASGTTCSGGRCSASCQDECSANACSGFNFAQCGRYGLDACKHLSFGVSCVAEDSCLVGRCAATGCESTPTICQTAPASTCKDPSTLTVYDAVGSCTNGTCTYASHTVACPHCPNCDACAGVICNAPPSPCFAATGTCSQGACTYPYADGGGCSTGDDCITGGQCSMGVCVGSLMVCNKPPVATCLSPTSLRTYSASGSCSAGACSYPFSDQTCSCQSGACAGQGTWTTVAPLPTARTGLAATTGSDGRIYTIGGIDSTGAVSAVVEVYTPSSNSWATAAPMPTARFGCAAATGPDGRIYAMGGKLNPYRAVVEVYTPSTNKWATAAPLPVERTYFGAVGGADGKIYAMGGYNTETANTAYDPSNNKWTDMASLPTGRSSLAVVAHPNGLIYALGGVGGLTTVESYATATNNWQTAPAMTTPREAPGAAVGGDGRIYAIAGFDRSNGEKPINSVEAWTPGTAAWVPVTPMPTTRTGFAVAAGADGRIYVFGGSLGGVPITYFNTVEALAP